MGTRLNHASISQLRSRQKPVGRRSGGTKLNVLILLVLGCLIGVVYVNRIAIFDWWRLRGYHPPAAITQLANEDTMNAYTRHLFYLNKPQLLPTVATFRQKCPEDEDVIVLGCYHSEQNGIFIYNVQDPTLAGVQEVTAAHEVLHSVYARLSSADRKTLDSELESFYKHGLTDPQVLAEVKIYQKTEPNDVFDEMSCTFGTELATLPPSLNAYYARYFTNRMTIVAYEQRYQGQLVSRQNTIAQYDSQLSNLKTEFNSDESRLSSDLSVINAQQSSLLSMEKSSPSAYNAAVPGYNQQVDSYNALASTTQNLINQYNQLVVARNYVASQLDTLDGALDTRLAPQAKQ